MREAYQLSTSLNKDIYIGETFPSVRDVYLSAIGYLGSTHTLTPKHFVDDLKVLDLGGVGSRALPNGLKEAGSGVPRSFQEYYDERYFTQDAPRPTRQAAPVPVGNSRLGAQDTLKPSKISPTNSYQGSTHSITPSVKEDKKKKKGLFRF